MKVIERISHKKFKQELKIKKRILERLINEEQAEAERLEQE